MPPGRNRLGAPGPSARALAAVAGRGGGAGAAVEDAVTWVVGAPRGAGAVGGALAGLLGGPARRAAMGAAARHRAESAFAYDHLAARLAPLAGGDLSG